MGKISTEGMKKLLMYMEENLKGMDTMTLIVAGMIATKHLSNPEFVVAKVQDLKALVKNIQLNKEKEIIMHSTHSLRRFITEDETLTKKRDVKNEEKKREDKVQITQRAERSQKRSQTPIQPSSQNNQQISRQISQQKSGQTRNRSQNQKRNRQTTNRRARRSNNSAAKRQAQRRKAKESEEDDSKSSEKQLPKVEEDQAHISMNGDKAEEQKEKPKNVETVPDNDDSKSISSNGSVECLTVTNCDICGSKYLEPDIVSNSQCIHQYHEKCLRNHIINKLDIK